MDITLQLQLPGLLHMKCGETFRPTGADQVHQVANCFCRDRRQQTALFYKVDQLVDKRSSTSADGIYL